MKLKYISPILAVVTLTLTAASVLSASNTTEKKTIYCETSSETPTTMAKTLDGGKLPIFHWRTEALPDYLNPEELCTQVSEKLQTYSTQGYQLSSFQTHKQNGLPVICAEETVGNCNLVLFTLEPSKTLSESNRLLDKILDDSLKGEEISSTERGVQFHGYKVNFWDLLGF
jgi:hypothetical protein